MGSNRILYPFSASSFDDEKAGSEMEPGPDDPWGGHVRGSERGGRPGQGRNLGDLTRSGDPRSPGAGHTCLGRGCAAHSSKPLNYLLVSN